MHLRSCHPRTAQTAFDAYESVSSTLSGVCVLSKLQECTEYLDQRQREDGGKVGHKQRSVGERQPSDTGS